MIVDYLLSVARIGGIWVLYLLLGLSVLSVAVMVERWLYFRSVKDRHRGLRDRIATALREGELHHAEKLLDGSRSIEARVIRKALAWRHGGPRAVSDAIESELGEQRRELERGLNFLGTLGNNAPFIGLFGTVLGVIEAFHHLAGGANKAAMGSVMSGIAEALVATGVGLFVAIPAVIAYNSAQKRIGEIDGATTGLGKLVTAYLESSKKQASEPVATERVLSVVAGCE